MPRLPRSVLASFVVTVTSIAFVVPGAHADRRPHAGMMRYPDVSATQIVFVYRNNLWLVPREGGIAVPLAAPTGAVGFPRFSPDNQTVAFVGNYDGNRDLYTIPVEGGVPFRVTHHPNGEVLCDWTPNGALLFFVGGYGGFARQPQLYTVAATGGMPAQLPVPYGAFGAISPDGTWLAYILHTTDNATWKRYQGGMATDIWLFNLRDHTSKKITDWVGTDTQPMWHGDKVYYLSDEGATHRLNIWVYDTKSGKREQLTKYDDFDAKWPAVGPGPGGDGEIVYQHGADLCLLDLKTGKSRVVAVTVPGDLPTIRPQRVEVREQVQSFDISPTGKRALFEARGDIYTVPAQKGSTRDLTRTSGVAERMPSWSPDGRWIAYFSDQTGEYELYLRRSDGLGDARQLTHDGHAFRYNPTWSPDSKRILFTDKTGALYMFTLPEELTKLASGENKKDEPQDATTKEADPAGELKLIDVDPWASQAQVSWSHDSNWIAYTRTGDSTQTTLWLYSVPTGEKKQLTSGMFNDTWPTFDRKGEYMFFASNRHFANPIYEDVGSTFVYSGTDTLVVVPLRVKVGSPWAPKSDEESWKVEGKDKEKDKDKGKGEKKGEDADQAKEETGDSESEGGAKEAVATQKAEDEAGAEKAQADEKKDKEEKKPLEIELAGFEQRAILLPVKPDAFRNLAVNSDGKLLYVRGAARGQEGPGSIKIFDLTDEKKEEKTVVEGAGSFSLSGDGKKLIVNKEETYAIVDAAPSQSLDKPLALDGLATTIEPRAEWRQLFTETWRLQRDFFYDPNMHGVNWPGMRDHYIKMLDDCVSRADVSYVIRELIAELNVGHAYYWGGDGLDEKAVPIGLLGVDLELDSGAYRIKKIVQGGPWDLDARGPLSQPGVNVKEGDYLLAINGIPLDPRADPWAAFQGLPPGHVVTITVSDKPTLEPIKPESPPLGGEPEKKDGKDKEKDAQKDEKKDEKAEKKADEKKDEEKPATGQRDVVVTLIGSTEEAALRYRAWIEHNRAYVAEKTDGKVGYLHVPDTGTNGQNELFRQFYGQRDKAALIIDERWNGGGQIPNRFIELLNRPITNYWARRDGHDWPNPSDAQQGPKCMLINGLAGSGGDAFPFYFRQSKLGKLIGMRTWGGLVGISGNPNLIDGATVTVPTFGFYKTNGTWGVEGHGVDPDIEVVDDPAKMVEGGDPQLDKAIELMLTEVKEHPHVPPSRPPYPNRSGAGVPEKDW